jgi:uncharacterized membrane protein
MNDDDGERNWVAARTYMTLVLVAIGLLVAFAVLFFALRGH